MLSPRTGTPSLQTSSIRLTTFTAPRRFLLTPHPVSAVSTRRPPSPCPPLPPGARPRPPCLASRNRELAGLLPRTRAASAPPSLAVSTPQGRSVGQGRGHRRRREVPRGWVSRKPRSQPVHPASARARPTATETRGARPSTRLLGTVTTGPFCVSGAHISGSAFPARKRTRCPHAGRRGWKGGDLRLAG